MASSVSYSSLKFIPLFRDVDERDVEKILEKGNLRPYAKDAEIFSHGDPLKSFCLVVSGAVRKFRSNTQGKEVTIGVLTPGSMIGALHIFEACVAYQWNAVALEDTVLLEYPVARMRERIKQPPVLALNILSELSHMAQLAYLDAEHKQTFTATQRLACFLLRVSTLHGFNPQKFELPYGKAVIASKLGMEPETFSRAVKKLQDYGVTIGGAEVGIADQALVEQHVCEECSMSEDCDVRQVTPLHEAG